MPFNLKNTSTDLKMTYFSFPKGAVMTQWCNVDNYNLVHNLNGLAYQENNFALMSENV